MRNLWIVGVLAGIVAIPLLFRQDSAASDWRSGDPVLVIISPHNEAIRYEFDQAFNRWHRERYGRPVRIEWRNIGGTTEVSRYLASEYQSATRAAWMREGKGAWPSGATPALTSPRLPRPPAGEPEQAWVEQVTRIRAFYREQDDPRLVSCGVDLFFGGGTFDHSAAADAGFTVAPWAQGRVPAGLFETADGLELIPRELGGEVLRGEKFFGNAGSAFGICYNVDWIARLEAPIPEKWADLAHERYFRRVGMGDPTKSGSIAKAIELMVHEQMSEHLLTVLPQRSSARQTIHAAELLFDARKAVKPGQSSRDPQLGQDRIELADASIAHAPAVVRLVDFLSGIEQELAVGMPIRLQLNEESLPAAITWASGFPEAYEAALAKGWLRGVAMVQAIGANSRYFTDAAGKVPVDVASGDAAIGLAIDFFGRFQENYSRGPDGQPRLRYVTPLGGTSISADPISLLRGAPNREIAVRFIEFVLSEDGQKVWCYQPGAPGGPQRYALRRLPLRKDFYPIPPFEESHARHQAHSIDDLASPQCNPWSLAEQFQYYSRWTSGHFSLHRELFKCMCIDAGPELRDAMAAIIELEQRTRRPASELRAQLARMPDVPEPLTWSSGPGIRRNPAYGGPLVYMRQWTIFFRDNYRDVRRQARAQLAQQAG